MKRLLLVLLISPLFLSTSHFISADSMGVPEVKPPVQKAVPQTSLEAVQTVSKVEVAVAPVVPKPVVGVTNCGDNVYKQFIYQHESGCRTNAINPIGACGLGQAWPCSKMGCSLDDFACQDAFFTAYAQRYGGWEGSYNFWLGHSWW